MAPASARTRRLKPAHHNDERPVSGAPHDVRVERMGLAALYSSEGIAAFTPFAPLR
jgi:hypothetical protein